MGGFSSDSKDWVNIGIITRSFMGDPASKLLEINLSVAVSIKLVEESLQLVVVENTTDSLKSLFKLAKADSAVTF